MNRIRRQNRQNNKKWGPKLKLDLNKICNTIRKESKNAINLTIDPAGYLCNFRIVFVDDGWMKILII